MTDFEECLSVSSGEQILCKGGLYTLMMRHGWSHRAILLTLRVVRAGLPIIFCISIVVFYFTYYAQGISCVQQNNITNLTIHALPSILWHTYCPYTMSLGKTISCFDVVGNAVKCNVFQYEKKPPEVDAYLFYANQFREKFPLPRNPATIWGLFNEESPNGATPLLFEKFLNLFNFSATYSRYSDVPMTLYWVRSIDFITNTEYYVNTSTKNSLLSELAPVMYMQSDCDTATERDQYVKKLMEYIKVDSYGACLNNKEPPRNYMTSDDYLNQLHDIELMQFIGRYKFAVTIENGVCNDYMTEKLWRTLAAGVVPIYLGSPSVRDWLPNPKSAILIEDYPTPELMSRHLYRLLDNDTEYDEYLAHKVEQVITNERLIDEMVSRPFQTNLMVIVEQFECLVCRRLNERNSSRVDIVTKSHFDCPVPVTALTLATNKSGCWYRDYQQIEKEIDALYMIS